MANVSRNCRYKTLLTTGRYSLTNNLTTEGQPILLRAFEMAQSGQYGRVEAIRDALRKEGYSAAEVMSSLGGKSIAQQLRTLCRAAKTAT
jgi:hypothetical protein